ncbi:MAG: cytidine deaminase [Oligella ureolytica]|jgi:cytidine deaminase|nr:cytidine deaminase [Oligella ureolytica]
MDKRLEELVQKAEQAFKKAYAPYSTYLVGAAVLWESGRITAGCNVENASYGLTVCAERNAIFQGVALGERTIRAIAIAVPAEEMPTPCGSCRQVIREFAKDCLIILRNGLGQTTQTSLAELLPNSFGPDFLNKKP